jgi:hypothetical protein
MVNGHYREEIPLGEEEDVNVRRGSPENKKRISHKSMTF